MSIVPSNYEVFYSFHTDFCHFSFKNKIHHIIKQLYFTVNIPNDFDLSFFAHTKNPHNIMAQHFVMVNIPHDFDLPFFIKKRKNPRNIGTILFYCQHTHQLWFVLGSMRDMSYDADIKPIWYNFICWSDRVFEYMLI